MAGPDSEDRSSQRPPPFDVLGCGTVLIDHVRHIRGDRPATEIVQWGGPTGNALALLSAFGLRTALIAAIGADENEPFIRGAMRTFGVEDELLVRRPNQHTATVGIEVRIADANATSDNIRCLGLKPGRGWATLRRKDLTAAHFKALERAHLIHFDWAGAAAIALAQAAFAWGIPVSLDLPRFRPSALRDIKRLLPCCAVLFANERSARKHLDALGVENFFAASPTLRLSVVTRGERGAEARTGPGDGGRRIAVPPVPPRGFHDSLGAGDAFIAAVLREIVEKLLLGHLNSEWLDECLFHASRLASRACEHPGAKGLATHLLDHPREETDPPTDRN